MRHSFGEYINTDLICENDIFASSSELSGVISNIKNVGNISIHTVDVINKNGERLTGKSTGRYVTIHTGKAWEMSEDELSNCVNTIAEELKSLLKFMGKPIDNSSSVLVVGLGNRHITSDALGPTTTDKIFVTRHIFLANKALFDRLNFPICSAFSPGVMGQTGIDSRDLINSIVKMSDSKPDLVIVIDALASKSVDRLLTTIQLSSNGITPGSAVGKGKNELTYKSLGVPVISIGVPTIVSSSTMIVEALEKSGVCEISPSLAKILNNGKSFFVTLNNNDIAIEAMSDLLANGINKALCIK